MSGLRWETLDSDAAYPRPVYRAKGVKGEYLIAQWRKDRPGAGHWYFGDAREIWCLSTANPPTIGGALGLSPTLRLRPNGSTRSWHARG